jgi:transposase-like protein
MGAPVAEACRKLGVIEQTFCRWKRTFAGKGGAEWGGFARWRHRTASVNHWSST